MKLKLLTALVAGLLATGAYAASEPAKQDKSGSGQDRSASQGMQRSQQDGASQTEQRQAGGMSSETVRKAQQALKDKGHDPGPVDGIMGPQTQAAIKKFQQSQGNMKGTGQLDQQTLSALGVEGGAGSTGAATGTPRGAAPPAAGGSPAASTGGKQPDTQKSR